MAFWGEPVHHPDHADRAADCALAMQATTAQLARRWVAEGKPDIHIGVGINTAEVVVGNIGSVEHKLDYTVLYPGVRKALDRLRDAGVPMAVLTNKPLRISRAIVDGLGIGGHFRRVYGGNSFDFKKPHPIGVETLIEECGASRERTMMVGDSSVDIQTARNAHVKSCGVTYGFQPETLRTVPPDLLVDRMEDLADWVIGHSGPATSANRSH